MQFESARTICGAESLERALTDAGVSPEILAATGQDFTCGLDSSGTPNGSTLASDPSSSSSPPPKLLSCPVIPKLSAYALRATYSSMDSSSSNRGGSDW